MVVGSVIGAGIFLVPHRIATLVGCSSAMLSVWAVAGAISLFGVLAIAELAGRHPQAGGLYVFLRESYGRPVAFLYGWTFTPHKETLDSPFLKKNVRELIPGLHKVHPRIYALQSGYRRCGQSGIEVSDWWPHVGASIDDLAVVRSMWTTDNNHGAQFQFHSGPHILEGNNFPSIGSWVHYGLGSLNENLPQFVVLGEPDSCCLTWANAASYLGPEHSGVRFKVDPEDPLPFASPGPEVYKEEQESQFGVLKELNQLSGVEYPKDPALQARIKAYELAFRMQMAVPEVLRFKKEESEATQKLYGLDQEITKPFGEICLTARRLVERGVRFIGIFNGGDGGAGAWDAHSNLKKSYDDLCVRVDKPIGHCLKIIGG
jgi:hypothetical protein